MSNINDSYARDLDLNLLRVFAVVAEEGSLTRAASRLYVTQPAISASIRRLTAFVGAKLITRQGHGVVPTTRGTELLSAARAHLQPLVAATTASPLFDPKRSTATIRVGLADCLEAVLLPTLLSQLRIEAPHMPIVVVGVQFRTVEEMLLSRKIDFAVTVADDLPRSIHRQSLGRRQSGRHAFVCLYDPRFAELATPVTEREYFQQDHVVVSYAGDVRGIVEDSMGKSRTVRVSVPAFGYVADVVDGSSLVATVPHHFARHVIRTRPHLRTSPLPFALESVGLELLWSRVTDSDAATRFVRGLVANIVEGLESEPHGRAVVGLRKRSRPPTTGGRRR
jgi:LysR family transcriptional activator of mexEF-oprN operon